MCCTEIVHLHAGVTVVNKFIGGRSWYGEYCNLTHLKEYLNNILVYKFAEKYLCFMDGIMLFVKGTRIQSQFIFLMEKSILCAKITVSQKNGYKTQF